LRNLKAIFVIGVPVIVNGSQMEIDRDAQIKLELEYAQYGDILQVSTVLQVPYIVVTVWL
jgi:hypothetical protein